MSLALRKFESPPRLTKFVPLSATELRAWRCWFPQASTFDVLLMRKRNGGRLHCVMGGNHE